MRLESQVYKNNTCLFILFDFLKSGKRYPTRLLDLEPNLTSLFMHFKHSSKDLQCSELSFSIFQRQRSDQTSCPVIIWRLCYFVYVWGVCACSKGQNEENHKNWSLFFLLFFLEDDDMIG